MPSLTEDTRALRTVELRKAYGVGSQRTEVLRGIDLQAGRGECVFLVGPSGSGKSTLLSILGCILSADSGQVSLLGQDATHLSPRQRCLFRREHVGFVFQRFHLFRGLTARENVEMTLRLRRTSARQAARRAENLLHAVDLADKSNVRVTRLSVGQQQRVAIARALVAEPEIVLADEPTAALDAQTGQGVMQLLRQLAARNHATVLVVTHDPRIIREEDRVIYLEDGRLKSSATSFIPDGSATSLMAPRDFGAGFQEVVRS